MSDAFYIIVAAVVITATYSAVIVKFTAVFQQCGYRAGEYFACFSTSLKRELIKLLLSSVALSVITAFTSTLGKVLNTAIAVVCFSAVVAIFVKTAKLRVKTVVTKRLVRIYVAAYLSFAACVVAAYVSFGKNPRLLYPAAAGLYIISPLFLVVGKIVNCPLDGALYVFYCRRARKTLESRKDVIKIAVTGSCGKTTVKNYLAALLSPKYKVLATPASYNTPLGISLALKKLNSSHRVFIAEMGARRRGDIKKLCKIVKPDITVITGITPQHMQTFGSVENIIEEKSRAINALGDDGLAVISGDTKGSLEIYVRTSCAKVLAGLNKSAFFRAENVKFDVNGTSFTFVSGENRYPLKAKFLGRHNVTDFLLAAAVAVELGVSTDKICSVAHTLDSPEHRFRRHTLKDGTTIIDDGYNANIEGLKSAAEVVAGFGGTKVIVTAGIAEGGKKTAGLNYKAGEILGSSADVLIAVGSYAKYVASGAENKCRVITVENLTKAKEELEKINFKGGVVLFANDLPDKF